MWLILEKKIFFLNLPFLVDFSQNLSVICGAEYGGPYFKRNVQCTDASEFYTSNLYCAIY